MTGVTGAVQSVPRQRGGCGPRACVPGSPRPAVGEAVGQPGALILTFNGRVRMRWFLRAAQRMLDSFCGRVKD